jgi:hypothetical protein
MEPLPTNKSNSELSPVGATGKHRSIKKATHPHHVSQNSLFLRLQNPLRKTNFKNSKI